MDLCMCECVYVCACGKKVACNTGVILCEEDLEGGGGN